ncbi:MAG: flagellar biosynthesis protein FlhB [Vulcanimicrobiota bacterium]
MSEDKSEKTEEPTEHKLQESRKKGQVFKSQDIIQTLLLLTTASLLYTLRGWLCDNVTAFAKWSWNLITPDIDVAGRNMFDDGMVVVVTYFKILAPLFAAAFIVAIIANLAQIKFVFTFETMKPKLSKLNPIQGFKKIFSMKSFVELLKQLAKLGIVTYTVIKVIKGELLSLRNASLWEITQTLSLVRKMSVRVVSWVIAAMMVISILDFIFQKKQFMKDMKMSMKELKDEYKETEGNPQVKGKIKQLMRQGAQNRMMEEVPNSSAVVTNPTHLAVAIRYIPGKDKAPTVVAKGKKLVAVQIKIMAEDNDIPIIENVELARALFSACEVGSMIPVELYKATAEVLAYVFRLKKKRELMKKRRFMAGRSGSYAQ